MLQAKKIISYFNYVFFRYIYDNILLSYFDLSYPRDLKKQITVLYFDEIYTEFADTLCQPCTSSDIEIKVPLYCKIFRISDKSVS